VLYRVLGPLERRVGEEDWSVIAAPKCRTLLGALLLSPGRTVPVAALVDEMWPQDPPLGARKLVSAYVSRLRRVIDDPDGRILVTRPSGYLLAVGSGQIDAGRFEELVAAGRLAACPERAQEASERLAEALGLWRGSPLADVPAGPIIMAESVRLEELRLEAAELRAEADIACGRYAQVVADLRRLTTTHQLREHLHALLMLALCGMGARGEALATYERARRALREELGIEPSLELRNIYRQILDADLVFAPRAAIPWRGGGREGGVPEARGAQRVEGGQYHPARPPIEAAPRLTRTPDPGSSPEDHCVVTPLLPSGSGNVASHAHDQLLTAMNCLQQAMAICQELAESCCLRVCSGNCR
jgi:DNA-binding SARP family transcriptional activator